MIKLSLGCDQRNGLVTSFFFQSDLHLPKPGVGRSAAFAQTYQQSGPITIFATIHFASDTGWTESIMIASSDRAAAVGQ